MRSKDFSWRYSLPATLLLLSPFDLLASLGMDMYLPVVPFMADALGSGAGTIQLTLTAYLVLLGAGQLLFGPLSDRLGRRPVLLGGGIAYIAASFGLTVVSSPELFLSFRVLQACGASACLVSTFATVRDIYSGREESNVIYGLLGSMLAMVPAIGPLLGALVDAWLGWRNLRLARDGNDRRCYRSLATLARDSAAPDGRPTVVAAIDSCETPELLAVHALLQRGDGQLFRLFLDRPLANDGEARVIAT